MSSTEGALSKFSELMLLYKDRCEVFEALSHLNTCNKEEINKIFQQIKKILIDSNENSVNDILVLISKFAIFNNRYFRSYWELFKLIFEEYRPKYEGIHPLFYYLIYKEYGIGFEEKCGIRFSDLESQHVSLNTLEENTISKAIMDDNVQSFINFTKVNGFNENQKLKSVFYPEYYEDYSLLEISCLYGSIECFRYIRTTFHAEITPICLSFSFLGRNTEIVHECLTNIKPDNIAMECAIISHNMDYVTLLYNTYNLKIEVFKCIDFRNLPAFFYYYEQTNDAECFIQSPELKIQSLCAYFISHGASINEKSSLNRTAVHFATKCNDNNMVEFLILHGADINIVGDILSGSCLQIAITNRNLELVKILLSHGAKLKHDSNEQYSAFRTCARCGTKEIAQLLLDHGADFNAEKGLLHDSALKNNTEVAEFLLQHGADINARSFDDSTPLHRAALGCSFETAKFLIDNGANVNAKTKIGITPLHILAWHPCQQAFYVLLRDDRIENSKETDKAAVFQSVSNKIKDLIEYFISHGVEIDAKDEKGKTPLHYASKSNNFDMVEVLISHNADINAKSQKGKSALFYAEKANNKEIADYLKSHGAETIPV